MSVFGLGVLSRYLIRQNIYLMLICLSVGTGIYLLSEVFDRLDDFFTAGLGASTILYYFAVKMPLIISQLMPAIFLLAMVIQLGVLIRSKEMLALRAGGVAFSWFIRFFFIYALVWSVGQLAFSQYFGVWGESEALRIWNEDVRKRQLDERYIKNFWLRSGDYIILAQKAQPAKNEAVDLTVYGFDETGKELVRIIKAARMAVTPKGWVLANVVEQNVSTFESVRHLSMTLPIKDTLKEFAVVELKGDKTQLPIMELSKAIKRLEKSGSNVEILRTAWHGKWSYAFSIAVMALMALTIITFSENVYANIGYSLILIFIQYGVHVVGATAGENGVLPPLLAAWIGNIVMGGIAALRLAWVASPRLQALLSR